MKGDTKEQNKQKKQKYNSLKLILLYLLTFCLSVPFSEVDEFNAPNHCLSPEKSSKTTLREIFIKI